MKSVTKTAYYNNEEGETKARLTLDTSKYHIKLEFERGEQKTTYIHQSYDTVILVRAEELYNTYKWLHAKLLNVEEFTEQIITHEHIQNPWHDQKKD